MAKNRPSEPASDPLKIGPRYLIKTPVRNFSGVRAHVKFKEGVGRTDNLIDAMSCQRFGYEVTDETTGEPLDTQATA